MLKLILSVRNISAKWIAHILTNDHERRHTVAKRIISTKNVLHYTFFSHYDIAVCIPVSKDKSVKGRLYRYVILITKIAHDILTYTTLCEMIKQILLLNDDAPSHISEL